MLGWILIIVGGLCPVAGLWHLSDYTIDPQKSIWWGQRLSRAVYTPDGQRRLVRWRPLIIASWVLLVVGIIMLVSPS